MSNLIRCPVDGVLWRSVFVSEKCLVTINYPPQDLVVGFDPTHAEFDSQIQSFKPPGSIVILVDRPLLPGNGIVLWWSV